VGESINAKREGPERTDPADVLSGVWILASIDQDPAMSYAGIRHRLGLGKDFNLRGLIAEHGELFRVGITEDALEKLKQKFRSKPNAVPAWLQEIPEKDREDTIKDLTTDDFFRSQFRTRPEADRSPTEIIEWGLQHIERLRKSRMERREERQRRWSTLVIPAVTALVAFGTLIGTVYFQQQTLRDQRHSREYEVRADSYSRFVQALWPATQGSVSGTRQAIDEADRAFVQLEPFLDRTQRDQLWREYRHFANACLTNARTGEPARGPIDSSVADCSRRRDRLRGQLYAALFH
jgi:hypothetical protein